MAKKPTYEELEQKIKELEKKATKRKHVEKELRESEHKYRKLLDLSPDPVVIIQDDHHQLVSSAFHRVFGYTKRDIDNGLGVLEPLHEDYKETVQKQIEDRYAGKEVPRSLRVDMISKDGKIIPCESSSTLIQYNGRPAVLVIIRDITERKHAEDALRESEERFKTLVTNIPGVTYRCACDSDWTMEYISDEVENLCGHPASEFLQNRVRSYASIIHPEDVEMVEDSVYGGVKNKSPYTIDYRIVHADGRVRHVYERGQGVFDEHGEVAWLDGAIFDITERKRAEEALRESEEKYRLLMENVGAAVISFDKKFNIVMANNRTCEDLGIDFETLQGMSLYDLFSDSEAEHYVQRFLNIAKDGKQSVFEDLVEIRGDKRWMESRIESVKDSEGNHIGYLDIASDITERKRAEAELEERTKQVEAANKELKDFAYIVSHDLKAPLRAVSNLVRWIEKDYKDAVDEDGKELINLLLGRVKRMNNLIDGVLQYSRIGRIREKEKVVDLNAVAEEAINLIGTPDNIQITIEDRLPSVRGGKTRLGQVFQNLLDNAIKFMDKPGGEVKIGCADEGTHWRLSVADNGPGIDEGYHEKIFQVFQTLTPRDELESTGIGLTLVKKVIENAGGRIWVESTAGKGSTFFFTLPKNGGEQ